MGASPSAFVFYGYDLGDWTDPDSYEALYPEWVTEEVFLDHVADHVLDHPRPPFPAEIDWQQGRDEALRQRLRTPGSPENAIWEEWRAKLAAREAAVKALNVEIANYAALYDGDPAYVLRVIASTTKCGDWGSTRIDPASLVKQPEWDDQLARMIDLLGLTLPRGCEPGWHIACAYG